MAAAYTSSLFKRGRWNVKRLFVGLQERTTMTTLSSQKRVVLLAFCPVTKKQTQSKVLSKLDSCSTVRPLQKVPTTSSRTEIALTFIVRFLFQ